MWLCDLEKAIQEVKPLCLTYVFTKITPTNRGILFHTSHFSKVAWSDGGQIIEHFDDGRIEILRNFK